MCAQALARRAARRVGSVPDAWGGVRSRSCSGAHRSRRYAETGELEPAKRPQSELPCSTDLIKLAVSPWKCRNYRSPRSAVLMAGGATSPETGIGDSQALERAVMSYYERQATEEHRTCLSPLRYGLT